MKFFKPQIQLVREPVLDRPDAYSMHVVTFCNRTNYRADGFSVNDSDLNDGLYRVTVNLIQDPSLPDFQYITPVVHTFNLGSIAFPGGEGWFEVQVTGAVIEATPTAANRDGNPPTTTTKTGGTGTVSTSDADGLTRPVDANAL